MRRFRRQRFRLTALLFVAYVGYYFCRVTFPVALPVISDEFRFSNTQMGVVLSAFYTVYALAKLVNGFLGDRIGGKLMLLIGIAGSVVCNVMFGFGRELFFFVLIWGANAYFQSMGWLSLVPILARWYPSRETGRAMGVMSLSYQAGDFVARSSAAILIVLLGWSGLFWAHAALLGVLGLLFLRVVQPSPEGQGLPDLETYEACISTEASGVPTRGPRSDPDGGDAESDREEAGRWLREMLANRWFWVVCITYLFLSIIRYIFWGWSIQYLIDAGATLGTATLTSAIFPLFGSVGSITAGWVSDRLGARRGPVLAAMCLLMTGAIYVFSRVPGDEPVALMIALGLVGFTLYGPYSLMAGAVAMDFGWKHASGTAAGIIDAVGAVGAILTGVGMGRLIDVYGWTDAFNIVIALAAVASLLCFSLWNLRPTHPSPH